MSEVISIMSPVGRMVQGHPMKMSDKGFQGKQLTDKQGNVREECFFAVAFPKTDPLMAEIWQQLQRVAQAGFPGGQSQWPTFSWKVKDGDQPPHNGKEGFPGHYVISFKSGWSPKIFTKGGDAQVVNQADIKCGDYVRVYFNIAPNGDLQKPGIYVNPGIVELVGYGEQINSGPDGSVFAAAPVALPAGASATPVAGAPLSVPAAAGNPVPAAAGNPVPAAAGNPVPAAAGPGLPAGVQPDPTFLAGPTASVASNAYTMTPKANSYTREQYHASGWTDEKLIAEGMMVMTDIPF